jgi:hypothetical protein
MGCIIHVEKWGKCVQANSMKLVTLSTGELCKRCKSRFFMAPSICSMRFGTICCCIPKKEENKYQKSNTILENLIKLN